MDSDKLKSVIGRAEIDALSRITEFDRLQDYESVLAFSYSQIARDVAELNYQKRTLKSERQTEFMRAYDKCLNRKWKDLEAGRKKPVTEFYMKGVAALSKPVVRLDQKLREVTKEIETLEADLEAIKILRAIIPGIQGRVRSIMNMDAESVEPRPLEANYDAVVEEMEEEEDSDEYENEEGFEEGEDEEEDEDEFEFEF